MYKLITEGKARIRIPLTKKISREMPVFYNPIMRLNRDVSVLLLNSIKKNNLQIALPLAATGIRGVRFLLELKKSKIKNISFNDYSKEAVKLIKNNLKLNKIKISSKNSENFLGHKKSQSDFFVNKKIIIKNEDANLFLLNSTGFDYIDIDPFGSPNNYLDSAIKRLARDGILAVTATDTAPLCGTYPTTCLRKYWAVPLRNELMHEIGLRILIRKIQLISAQYDKALTPIFSYYKDHYFRVFLKCNKGKKDVDKVIRQHGMFSGAGPLWLASLWDKSLIKRINRNLLKLNKKNKTPNQPTPTDLQKFLRIIVEESKVEVVGFYDIHKICKRYKIKQIPKKELIIKKIKRLGYKAAETHFNGNGIRSDIPLNKLLRIIQ